jgi:hypothetical protein
METSAYRQDGGCGRDAIFLFPDIKFSKEESWRGKWKTLNLLRKKTKKVLLYKFPSGAHSYFRWWQAADKVERQEVTKWLSISQREAVAFTFRAYPDDEIY